MRTTWFPFARFVMICIAKRVPRKVFLLIKSNDSKQFVFTPSTERRRLQAGLKSDSTHTAINFLDFIKSDIDK